MRLPFNFFKEYRVRFMYLCAIKIEKWHRILNP